MASHKEVIALNIQSVMYKVHAEENGVGLSKLNADPMLRGETSAIVTTIVIQQCSVPMIVNQLSIMDSKSAWLNTLRMIMLLLGGKTTNQWLH